MFGARGRTDSRSRRIPQKLGQTICGDIKLVFVNYQKNNVNCVEESVEEGDKTEEKERRVSGKYF